MVVLIDPVPGVRDVVRVPARFDGRGGKARQPAKAADQEGYSLQETRDLALIVEIFRDRIGYAQVAGLPPIVGLYAAILPTIVFALTCHTRHLVASPDAAVAAMIAAFLGAIAAPGDPRYVQLAFAQALLCGLIFFAFWVFRIGFLANFLSHAVLVGFITGLGLEVMVSQVRKILGVTVEAEAFFREVWELILAVPTASLWSIAIGLGTIVVVRVLKRFAPKLPGALIAIGLATIVVALLGLDQRGVSVLGALPSGLPGLTIPQVCLNDFVALFPGALALAAVTLAER